MTCIYPKAIALAVRKF